MRRVMDGIMYDSGTSEELARVASPTGTAADEAWCEILYRKASGEYWLYAEGGSDTQYHLMSRCNRWEAGWQIIVYTEEQARQWAEYNLDGDAYEAIWGPVSEDMPVPEVPDDSDWDPDKYII